jgi:hypothetical protein
MPEKKDRSTLIEAGAPLDLLAEQSSLSDGRSVYSAHSSAGLRDADGV